MKQVFKFDADGFYIEPVIVKGAVPVDCTEIQPPNGLFKAKFVDGQWVEGLSQAEIDAIKNAPQPKSEIEIVKEENAQLNLQIIDLWETLINAGVI